MSEVPSSVPPPARLCSHFCWNARVYPSPSSEILMSDGHALETKQPRRKDEKRTEEHNQPYAGEHQHLRANLTEIRDVREHRLPPRHPPVALTPKTTPSEADTGIVRKPEPPHRSGWGAIRRRSSLLSQNRKPPDRPAIEEPEKEETKAGERDEPEPESGPGSLAPPRLEVGPRAESSPRVLNARPNTRSAIAPTQTTSPADAARSRSPPQPRLIARIERPAASRCRSHRAKAVPTSTAATINSAVARNRTWLVIRECLEHLRTPPRRCARRPRGAASAAHAIAAAAPASMKTERGTSRLASPSDSIMPAPVARRMQPVYLSPPPAPPNRARVFAVHATAASGLAAARTRGSATTLTGVALDWHCSLGRRVPA